MDYVEEMGGMTPPPVLRLHPTQIQKLAHQYVGRPAMARCSMHEGEDAPGRCMDCRAVRLQAESLTDHKTRRFTAAEIEARDRRRACQLCDARGLAKLRLRTGEELLLHCPHEPALLEERRAAAAQQFMEKLTIRRAQREPGAIDYGEEIKKRLQQ